MLFLCPLIVRWSFKTHMYLRRLTTRDAVHSPSNLICTILNHRKFPDEWHPASIKSPRFRPHFVLLLTKHCLEFNQNWWKCEKTGAITCCKDTSLYAKVWFLVVTTRPKNRKNRGFLRFPDFEILTTIAILRTARFSGGSRHNFDRVLSQKNPAKNEVLSIFIQIWKFWPGSRNLVTRSGSATEVTLIRRIAHWYLPVMA